MNHVLFLVEKGRTRVDLFEVEFWVSAETCETITVKDKWWGGPAGVYAVVTLQEYLRMVHKQFEGVTTPNFYNDREYPVVDLTPPHGGAAVTIFLKSGLESHGVRFTKVFLPFSWNCPMKESGGNLTAILTQAEQLMLWVDQLTNFFLDLLPMERNPELFTPTDQLALIPRDLISL